MSALEGSVPEQADGNELASFVTGTLTAIFAGVAEARKVTSLESLKGNGTFEFGSPKDIQFDIAVTAKKVDSSSSAINGGFKLQVFSAGADQKSDMGSENSTVSRIQFSIPSYFRPSKDD